MSFIPKILLLPLAKALAAVFYTLVSKSSDTQNKAEWFFSHYDIHDVPFGYKARVRLDLMHDENEQKPRRRAGDREIEAERSQDA